MVLGAVVEDWRGLVSLWALACCCVLAEDGSARKIGGVFALLSVPSVQRKYFVWYSNSRVIALIPVTPMLRWMWKWDFPIAPSPEMIENKYKKKLEISSVRPLCLNESIVEPDGHQHFHSLVPSIPPPFSPPVQHRKRSSLRASSVNSSCSHCPPHIPANTKF